MRIQKVLPPVIAIFLLWSILTPRQRQEETPPGSSPATSQTPLRLKTSSFPGAPAPAKPTPRKMLKTAHAKPAYRLLEGENVPSVKVHKAAAAYAANQLQLSIAEARIGWAKGGAATLAEEFQAYARDAQRATKVELARHGFYMRRIGISPMNPRNTPSAWEQHILEKWVSEPETFPEPVWDVENQNGRRLAFRYLMPQVLEASCLGCHGPSKDILPAVAEEARIFYPKGQGMGFSEGQLYGAISVQIPVPAELLHLYRERFPEPPTPIIEEELPSLDGQKPPEIPWLGPPDGLAVPPALRATPKLD